MTIFPERGRNGKPTGTYIVKVMRSGSITRHRTKDLEEAKRIESSLKSVLTAPLKTSLEPIHPSDPSSNDSLGFLASSVSLTYRGTKDERKSVTRLQAALSLLGSSDRRIDTIRTVDLDGLVSTMRRKGLSDKTINRHLATVSKALNWAYDRELILRKPKIPKLSEGSGKITYLTEEQEDRLYQWLITNDYPHVATVVRLLVATGFRVSELLSRTKGDLSRADEGGGGYWLRLERGQTKNNEPRAAWLSEALGSSLADLLDQGLPSYRTILESLREASVAAGIGFRVTPHVLRHTTATRLTSRGVPTAVVKEYLGHRAIQTTLKYAHVTKDSLRSAAHRLQKAVPLQTNDVPNGHQEA
jgi:site-specific recombinase XerD